MVHVPAASSVTLPADVTEHMVVVTGTLNVIPPDEGAVAVTVKAASPSVLFAGGLKLTVWLAFAAATVRDTSAAALYVTFPACEAVMVHVPVPLVMVTVPLLRVLDGIEHAPLATSGTLRPDVAAAVAVNVESYAFEVETAGAEKEMVWSVLGGVTIVKDPAPCT